MTYLVGIDGGGTKTVCLFREKNNFARGPAGQEDYLLTGPGTNPQVIGFMEMQNRLTALIQEGLKKFSILPEEIAAVSCGMAGAGRKEDEEQVAESWKEIAVQLGLRKNCLFSVHSDSYIALRGALDPDAEEGILVIAGTGSNAVGLTVGGHLFKSGGWGHLLGDEGSGYQIGLKALNSITRAYDRRGQATILTDKILEALDLTHPRQLIHYIYNSHLEKQDIAGFARIVIEAAENEDQVAMELLEHAARELALHVESLFRLSAAFHSTTPVTTTGSIFTYSVFLTNHFKRKLAEKNLGIYQQAYSTPVNGAILIAGRLEEKFKKAGDENDGQ